MTIAPETIRDADEANWWRGGTLYQIYPRSFADSNGDGIGDLPGITRHLDHVASLGVDGIWLSPFFTSPMKDYGYDISNYCDVDPMFGTLDDFRALVDRAHVLGLKVTIDQVFSHSSDQHPWFIESRSSTTNPKADWYVWADAKPDGTPPNNWLSIFGGVAWQWDTRRQQYYLHNFLTSQPDLNFHCAEMQQALIQSMKFWLDLGVDGFRLDVVNFYVHDALLRDNPPREAPPTADGSVNNANPYSHQWHVYDKSRPENLEFLSRMRALMDEYPNITSVGEIGDDHSLERVAEYTAGSNRLHMAYSFDLLSPVFGSRHLHSVIERFEAVAGSGWQSWALSNHDMTRVRSRWVAPDHPKGQTPDVRIARLAAATQFTMRGTPCVYQGDELGLPEADIGFEDLKDPMGIEFWPAIKGRDGCRTPMPWDAHQPNAGFGAGTPWLPIPQEHVDLSVAQQDVDADSQLAYYRQLIAWRKTRPSLISGSIQLLPAHDQVLAYVREGHGEKLLCAFNYSSATVTFPTTGYRIVAIEASGISGLESHTADSVTLAPWGGTVVAVG